MEKVERRRDKIFKYICERINGGSAPTVREICSDLHISSTSTVHSDLKELCTRGLIEMIDGLNRTIRLPGEPAIRVPLVGTVAAGTPILAVENIEQYIPFGIPNMSDRELFALRVRGDSMKNAAILEGDIVFVEKRNTAENGQIVVAMLDDEATVKRYFKENGHIRLQPENETLAPIIAENVEILGIVVGLQRFYS